jgi:hypothetical protein
VKQKIFIAVAAFAVGVGVTYYAKPQKIETAEKATVDTTRDKRVVTTETRKPSGEIKKRTVVTSTLKRKSESDKKTETTYAGPRTTVSVLSHLGPLGNPQFGVAVQRDALGPISIGAFGFQDGRIGLAAGISF